MRTAQHGKKTLERNAVKRKPGRRAIIEGEAQPHGLATIPLPHCCELLWSDYLLGAQLLCGFVLQVATAFVMIVRIPRRISPIMPEPNPASRQISAVEKKIP
jgi:hypothetical protein